MLHVSFTSPSILASCLALRGSINTEKRAHKVHIKRKYTQ